jgi:hypothetical protein
MSYCWFLDKNNKTGITSGTGSAYLSGEPVFIPGFCGSIFSFLCSTSNSFYVLLSFFYSHCIVYHSMFDLWLLITPLVSTNFSFCNNSIIKDEVLLTVRCPMFPSILIAKNLLTGSLKNRSIDNLETQKKSISMKNSQFFDYLLYANRNKLLIKF